MQVIQAISNGSKGFSMMGICKVFERVTVCLSPVNEMHGVGGEHLMKCSGIIDANRIPSVSVDAEGVRKIFGEH
jgi:hypothetical protein